MSRTLYVFTRKGLFTLQRTGEGAGGWQIARTAFLGEPVTAVVEHPREGALYAALNLGHFGCKLHRSADGGATWEEVAVPAYPPKPADAPEAEVWSLKQVWCLEVDGRGVTWAGTAPGGLFRREPGAAAWALVDSLWNRPERSRWVGGGYDYPGIHSIVLRPDDGARLALGVSTGGVWHSRDGGRGWECRCEGMWAAYMPPEGRNDPVMQDVHRIVACPANPDRLWAQHHNGVFRSDDGGMRWQEVTTVRPSTFGFSVAVHPTEPDTAWFVPAVKDERRIPVEGRLAVARTRDGGRTFEELRRGLPQEHAYDLVYRHGLEVAPDGRTLAMGSTTGSLWLSDDQGDRWQHFSAHLPPIFGVRFGA